MRSSTSFPPLKVKKQTTQEKKTQQEYMILIPSQCRIESYQIALHD